MQGIHAFIVSSWFFLIRFISSLGGKEKIIENFNIFNFELSQADMEKIAGLDTKESLFFSHRDPEMVKWIVTRKLHI